MRNCPTPFPAQMGKNCAHEPQKLGSFVGGIVRIVRDPSFLLRWISLIFIAAAIILTMVELSTYSRLREDYPSGMTIAGVPVGGLDPQAASQRLLQVYNSPVEIQYAGAVIHMDPGVAGFQIDTESMLAAADLQRTGSSFWGGFWDFLWNRQPTTQDVPLIASISDDRLQAYLQEQISPRYDQPAVAAVPQPGQTTFVSGKSGLELDVNRATQLIEDALKSPTNRSVALSYTRTAPGRPSLDSLKTLIEQIIDLTPFDGVVGIYMQDLQTGDELHFGYDKNHEISVEPTDIAFSAASSIKIPVMISVYKHFGPTLDDSTRKLMLEMITQSNNDATDALMDKIESGTGPLSVTADMKTLGLEDTFIAGYFYDGAPLLQRFTTPSNQRTDVVTNPDPYNQITPSDEGALLVDIYQCAQDGGGALVAAWPDKFNKSVCQTMVNSYLTQDRIGVLIQAGVPDGTQVAHKHGWISGPSGIIQNFSDAAIVYTPSGNFVLCIYVYHPIQALFDPMNKMFAQIALSVYNYFNLPGQ